MIGFIKEIKKWFTSSKVIGGLAHIPIVIALFYFILTFFNKRAINYAEANKAKKDVTPKAEAKKVAPISSETKTEAKKEIILH